MSRLGIALGRLLGVLLALSVPAGSALAASASTGQEPVSSRYAVSDSYLQRAPAQSASGRYRASGTLSADSRAPVAAASGVRFQGGAKLATDADCSDVLLADSFE